MTKILHAALKTKDGEIITGKSHADCFKKIIKLEKEPSDKVDDQGFLDSNNKFLNRKDAWLVAYLAGQLRVKPSILLSEDLWSRTYGGRLNYSEDRGYYE